MQAHVLLIGPFEFFLQVAPLLARTEIETEVAEPGAWALRRLASEDFDAALVCYPLPGIHLAEVIEHLRDDPAARLRGLVVVANGSDPVPEIAAAQRARVAWLQLEHRDRILASVSSLLAARPRLALRLEVELEVALGLGQTEIPCVSRNISLSGMLVETNAPLAIGSRVEARIRLPPPRPAVVCRAEVVRHTTPNRDRLAGMGLRLEPHHGEARRQWEEWVTGRLGEVKAAMSDGWGARSS